MFESRHYHLKSIRIEFRKEDDCLLPCLIEEVSSRKSVTVSETEPLLPKGRTASLYLAVREATLRRGSFYPFSPPVQTRSTVLVNALSIRQARCGSCMLSSQ